MSATAAHRPGEHLDDRVLDNPVWHALTGRHRDLAEGTGRARRYRSDVSVFAAVEDWEDPDVWSDVLDLVGPDAEFPFTGREVSPPEGWTLSWRGEGVQLVETPALAPAYDEGAVVLGAHDVPEMLALVERTRPGPFLPATHLMGRYRGIRVEGRLVAMAGERLKPDGWTEISAVCTDAAFRGRGLATRLVLTVAAGVRDRGDRALLHAAATNETAIRLYEDLGFAVRRRTVFGSVRTPPAS